MVEHPTCSHNPKVAGSNPAPATMSDEGLADVEAANPFRLPRLHPGTLLHRRPADQRRASSARDSRRHRARPLRRRLPREDGVGSAPVLADGPFIIVPDAGHAVSEPGILHHPIEATDGFAR